MFRHTGDMNWRIALQFAQPEGDVDATGTPFRACAGGRDRRERGIEDLRGRCYGEAARMTILSRWRRVLAGAERIGVVWAR